MISDFHVELLLIYTDAYLGAIKTYSLFEYYASIFKYSNLNIGYLMQDNKIIESPFDISNRNTVIENFKFIESDILAVYELLAN
jgi:hypothetical protein